MAESQNCAHDACSCDVEDDREFCSRHCENAAAQDGDGPCGCGHPDCG